MSVSSLLNEHQNFIKSLQNNFKRNEIFQNQFRTSIGHNFDKGIFFNKFNKLLSQLGHQQKLQKACLYLKCSPYIRTFFLWQMNRSEYFLQVTKSFFLSIHIPHTSLANSLLQKNKHCKAKGEMKLIFSFHHGCGSNLFAHKR